MAAIRSRYYGRTKLSLPPTVMDACSRSIRLSIKRSTVSIKLLQWNCVWNPSTVLPKSPSMISSFQGQMPNASEFGHGMCQNVMMVAFGIWSRIILGRRAKSAARAHDGFECRDQATRRDLQSDLPPDAIVDVGLHVGVDDDLRIGQVLGERKPERFEAPVRVRRVDRALRLLEVTQQVLNLH
jgi:hypothetical protein